jgi:hypothetical protein
MAKKPVVGDPWKDLSPKERKRRAARFQVQPDDLVVIRTDQEARQETERVLRERR